MTCNYYNSSHTTTLKALYTTLLYSTTDTAAVLLYKTNLLESSGVQYKLLVQ